MRAQDRVLLFGHNHTLLQTRCLVLEKAGFQVMLASDLAAAIEKVAVHQIHCMVLCQTLSASERAEVLATGEALRKELKFLVIEGEFTVLPADLNGAVLETTVHPRELIAAVEKITRGDGQSRLQA